MSTSTLPANVAVAAAILALDAAGDPVQRVKLLPMGEVKLRDGRGPFLVADRAAADRIVAASLETAGGTDIPIDYDHALVYAAPQGRPAPAAGWARGLEAANDGIYANIEWTAAAAAALAAREWRFISPVFTFDTGGNVLSVSCAGLTNFPAITDLPAIAAAATMETEMEMIKITVALGLAASASVDDIVAAIKAMTKDEATETAVAAAAVTFGLTKGATVADVVAAAVAAKPDPAKFVPIAALEEVTGQLGRINGERAGVAVAAAMAAGKVTPALKGWAVDYFIHDEAGFAGWLDKAPVVVAAGAVVNGQVAAAVLDNGLTADEAAACRMTGTTPENFLKAKKG